jgi:hypothetical protein
MIRSANSSRVLLLAEPRRPGADIDTVAVRRFRLARLRVEGRPADTTSAQQAKRA